MKFKNTLLFALLGLLSACTGKRDIKEDPTFADVKGTYFSVREFIKDQWEMNKMLPIAFEKKITSDDGKDTSYFVSAYKVELGHIMLTFANTDIGDRKYLGKYDFSEAEDSITNTRTFFYEAKDSDLYTRKLQIITDRRSNKIKNVYIEAAESSGWTRTSLKLYYAPNKVIRIQESRKSRFVSPKVTTSEYRFPE